MGNGGKEEIENMSEQVEYSKYLQNRFWQKVDKTANCWVWIGGRTSWGYGSIAIRHGYMKNTHRVSWEIHYGSIPKGMCVLHSCDNPPCVRPDHLFLGTLKDNSQDMLKKGRHLVKLTKDEMEKIRTRYAAENLSQETLAEKYNVGQSTISRIIRQEYPSHRLS